MPILGSAPPNYPEMALTCCAFEKKFLFACVIDHNRSSFFDTSADESAISSIGETIDSGEDTMETDDNISVVEANIPPSSQVLHCFSLYCDE